MCLNYVFLSRICCLNKMWILIDVNKFVDNVLKLALIVKLFFYIIKHFLTFWSFYFMPLTFDCDMACQELSIISCHMTENYLYFLLDCGSIYIQVIMLMLNIKKMIHNVIIAYPIPLNSWNTIYMLSVARGLIWNSTADFVFFIFSKCK